MNVNVELNIMTNITVLESLEMVNLTLIIIKIQENFKMWYLPTLLLSIRYETSVKCYRREVSQAFIASTIPTVL